jgi:hypothetical protein
MVQKFLFAFFNCTVINVININKLPRLLCTGKNAQFMPRKAGK